MQCLLNFAVDHGKNINTAWQYVLSTLQHLVWILGLQPTNGGVLKPSDRSNENNVSQNNPVLTTAVLSDLPMISEMLSKLFVSSKQLDDVALHHLINALCSLSVDSMDAAQNIKSPSLFAVAKLLETGLVNMDRIEILWRPVTGHLLEVSHHSNAALREWGAEGVVSLVRNAMKHYDPSTSTKLLHMFLLPFRELSAIDQQDVRVKQLDGVLQILQSCGDKLGEGWSTVLLIIGSATNIESEQLVRLGFRSVQLVISDFLLALPVSAIPCCIDVVEQYAIQSQDFNISLTAIGLLWSLSDYIHHNEDKITNGVHNENGDVGEKIEKNLTRDELWMYLFTKMGRVCMDKRPAVRKSMGQTLFSTLSAHWWSDIKPETLSEIIWKVLFPLMDGVQKACNSASTEKSEQKQIMVHHSRDTEEKQWQETSVLTLAGISRVFHTKHSVILKMAGKEKAWDKMLDCVQTAATSSSIEMSKSAIGSFEELLNPQVENSCGDAEFPLLWRKVWRCWCNIGIKITIPPPPGQSHPDEMLTQSYLTSFIKLFPSIYTKLHNSINNDESNQKSGFTSDDFKHLSQILHGVLCIPVKSDMTAFILPSSKSVLTPLQSAVCTCIDKVHKSQQDLYPAVFEFLLNVTSFATRAPPYGDMKAMEGMKYVCVNRINLAEYCMQAAVHLFQITSCHKQVVNNHVFKMIVQSLRSILQFQYGEITSTNTWQLAAKSFLKVMHVGLPVVRQHSQQNIFDNLWDELSSCMEDFLFPPHTNQSRDLRSHDQDEACDLEKLDVHLIEMIRGQILPHSGCFPRHFLDKVVAVLNKGSLTRSNNDMDNISVNNKSREKLSKECFEALFQFSVLPNGKQENGEMDVLDESNVLSLLRRCRTSITEHASICRKTSPQGGFPVSENQTRDVLFALKSVQQLMRNITNNKQNGGKILAAIFDLYPSLVELVGVANLGDSLKRVLNLYKNFLSAKDFCDNN